MRILDRLISIVNWMCILAAGAYIYAMLLYPWFKGGWENTHAVWYDWQQLNVGVLAFSSSVIAFNISRYHANQQRHRELIAARSFLPEALSELIAYFKSSAVILEQAFELTGGHAQPQINAPQLPANYREIFSRCIALADPELAEYLSYILMRLQVHHARISELVKELNDPTTFVLVRENLIAYMFRLGELQALVNNIFSFARGEEPFHPQKLEWEAMRNAYSNLNIHAGDFGDLENTTQRWLGRNREGWRID